MRFALGLILIVPVFGGGPDRAQQEAARRAQTASVRRMHDSVARQRAAAALRRTPKAAGGEIALFGTPAAFQATAAPAAFAGCGPMPEPQLAPLIEMASAKVGLAAELLRAVIGQESSFYPCAVSAKGALGLMQLMPATARDLEVEDPFDPEQNIDGGSRYLKQLLLRYGGDLGLALGAYNAGPTRVDQIMGIPPIAETQNYVERILKRLGGVAALRD